MLVSNEQLVELYPGESESVLIQKRNAAERYIGKICRIPTDLEEVPADLVEAALLLVSRLLVRRSSPDGTLGMSEFGVGRIARTDPDFQALVASYRRVVFG